MNSSQYITRRALLAAGGGAIALGQKEGSALTAVQVIDRIKANVGVPWRGQTVDNVIAGNSDEPVKGIATTMMATFDVLKRAAAANRNFIVTHESTFFSHQDKIEQFQKDETYLAKLDFITRNHLVVFHFHDHWHARKPDGIATGMIRELGWEKNVDADNIRLFSFPGVQLAQLAKEMQTKLKIRTMRVVGDPKLPVNRVIASWGNCSLMPGVPFLSRPDADVLVIGETHEWELVEYAQDSISAGKKKALIILGHVVSEQAGMKYCADWLKGFVPEVPVEFIAAAEPFWSPLG